MVRVSFNIHVIFSIYAKVPLLYSKGTFVFPFSPLKVIRYSIATPYQVHINSIESMDLRWSNDGVTMEYLRRKMGGRWEEDGKKMGRRREGNEWKMDGEREWTGRALRVFS